MLKILYFIIIQLLNTYVHTWSTYIYGEQIKVFYISSFIKCRLYMVVYTYGIL